jgi:hypothetical protein
VLGILFDNECIDRRLDGIGGDDSLCPKTPDGIDDLRYAKRYALVRTTGGSEFAFSSIVLNEQGVSGSLVVSGASRSIPRSSLARIVFLENCAFTRVRNN